MVKLVISNNNDQFRCSSGRSFSWPFTLIFPWRKRVTYNQVGILSQLKNITLINKAYEKGHERISAKIIIKFSNIMEKQASANWQYVWIILWKSCLEFRCITTLFLRFHMAILCLISRSINNHRWGTKSTFSRATKMHYETGSPKSTTPTPKPFLQRRLFVLLYTHLLVLCLACQNESRVKIKQK